MVAVLAATVPTWSQEPNFDNAITIELSGETVQDAMQILSNATGFNILVSRNVTGTITAYIDEMEAERALKEIVEVNGFHYVRTDDVVWVLSDEEYFEDFNLGRERRVIHFQHAPAQDLASVVAEIVGQQGQVLVYPATNVLIVAAVPERLEVVETVVRELDIPETTRVFQLEHAAAPVMLQLLQAHAGASVRMYADLRTNQISVRATAEQLDTIGHLLSEFDRPDLVVTKTIRLRYAKADVVADLLREVLTGRRTASSGQLGGQLPTTQDSETLAASRVATAAPPARVSSLGLRSAQGQTAPREIRVPPAPRETPSAPPAVTPSTETSAAEGEAGTAGLGPLANVTADTRTNSIIITHTEAVVARLESIIREVDVPNEFHVYQFLNVSPADIDVEGKLLALFATEDPYLNVDAFTRTVTFRCGPERAEEILTLLRRWDSTVRQVSINAEILSVNVSVIQELGISWQLIFDDPADSLGVFFPPGIATGASQGVLSAGNLGNDDYTATIQALATDSDTETIASPRIVVRDGQQAIFSTARNEPFTVVTVDGNTNTTLQDVRFLDVGVTLTVTPTINQEDLVTMDVLLEISDLVEIRNDIPVVDRSTAQSSISVRSGSTTILGGLRQSSRGRLTSGVPILRKIPLLGALFRNKRNDDSEFEILLILRPLIVDLPGDKPPSLEEISTELNNILQEDSPDYKLFLNERRKDP